MLGVWKGTHERCTHTPSAQAELTHTPSAQAELRCVCVCVCVCVYVCVCTALCQAYTPTQCLGHASDAGETTEHSLAVCA